MLQPIKNKHLFRWGMMLSLLVLVCLLFNTVLYLQKASLSGKAAPTQTLNGTAYDAGITRLTVSDADWQQFDELCRFPALETVDLRALPLTEAQYAAAAAAAPQARILWSVPLGSAKADSSAEELSLPQDTPKEQLASVAAYFPALKKLDTDGYPLCEELYALTQTLGTRQPPCEVLCRTKVCGVTLDSATQVLSLSGKTVSAAQLASLREAIPFFPGLQKVEMCDCGLDNGQMEKLNREFPDVRFVWTIRFLKYKVRTDAQVFSTLVGYNAKHTGTAKDFTDLLRYCTDLRALDLGHHQIERLDGIQNCKKLQILILGDNKITNVAPLVALKDLNYLEIFFNHIETVEPLSHLANMEQLNICFNYSTQDAETLVECKKLNMLYASQCGLSKQTVKTLKTELPEGCVLDTTTDNAVRTGWRQNEKSYAIRKAFRNWKHVESFEDWQHVTYRQGAKIEEPPD